MNAMTAPTDAAAEAYLAAKYGENFRAILGIVDYPHAERDDATFWANLAGFGPFDAAPDLARAAGSYLPGSVAK